MNCENCRFWSQMCAQAVGGGPVEALCLANNGPFSSKYTTGKFRCDGFKQDLFGKVDDPPNYGEFTRAEYERAEGKTFADAAVQ